VSIKTWQKEFYPIRADQTKPSEALAHSIRKWEGLSEKNLKKHNLTHCYGILKDKNNKDFVINDRSCALCFHFEKNIQGSFSTTCSQCILFKIRGKNRCDKLISENERVSPYNLFTKDNDPTVMLGWLYICQNSILNNGGLGESSN
jgi:hypothetical protein